MHLSEQATHSLPQATDPVERLRLLCLQRGAGGIVGFGKVFRRMDDDNSGNLSRNEFIKGLRETGLDLTDLDVGQLFERFDKDNSGSISYQEMIESIRPPLNANRLRLIEMAFSKLDKNGDGKVTVENLKSGFNVGSHPDYQNGDMSKEELVKVFLDRFEQIASVEGILTKEEFLDYYSSVSASIDEDMYFDLVMRQIWKL